MMQKQDNSLREKRRMVSYTHSFPIISINFHNNVEKHATMQLELIIAVIV